MVDVRFELTTNDPWSVDDAICYTYNIIRKRERKKRAKIILPE